MFSIPVRQLFESATKYPPLNYSPVFTALLCEVFPWNQYYLTGVYPKDITLEGRNARPWIYTAEYKCNLVLILDMRPPDGIVSAMSRAHADAEIRVVLSQYTSADTKASKIIALSCFGPKFRVYEYDLHTKKIAPEAPAECEVPSELWAHDFGTPDGEATFEHLVTGVKLRCKDLPTDFPIDTVPLEILDEKSVKKQDARALKKQDDQKFPLRKRLARKEQGPQLTKKVDCRSPKGVKK